MSGRDSISRLVEAGVFVEVAEEEGEAGVAVVAVDLGVDDEGRVAGAGVEIDLKLVA